jgi:hypothetical protein
VLADDVCDYCTAIRNTRTGCHGQCRRRVFSPHLVLASSLVPRIERLARSSLHSALVTGHPWVFRPLSASSPARRPSLSCRRSSPRVLCPRPLGHHFSPAQQPAGAFSRANDLASALITMRPRSPTRRTPLLASVPAHWLSRASSGITFCSARSARFVVSLVWSPDYFVVCGFHHAHIKAASIGIQPHANAHASILSYATRAFTFSVG